MVRIECSDYFRDPKDLPEEAGIYVVYACKQNPFRGEITSSRIIYIGKAGNIRERHYDPVHHPMNGGYCHDRLADFKKECNMLETLFYSFASVSDGNLDQAENALVAMQRPNLNSDLTDHYHHAAEEFEIYGSGALPFRCQRFRFTRANDISSLELMEDEDF